MWQQARSRVHLCALSSFPSPAVAELSSTSCPAAPCWECKWGKAEQWQRRFRHTPTPCLQERNAQPPAKVPMTELKPDSWEKSRYFGFLFQSSNDSLRSGCQPSSLFLPARRGYSLVQYKNPTGLISISGRINNKNQEWWSETGSCRLQLLWIGKQLICCWTLHQMFCHILGTVRIEKLHWYINRKFSTRKIKKKQKNQPTSTSLSCTFPRLSPSSIRLTAWMLVVCGEASGTLRAIAASAFQPSGYHWAKTVQVQDRRAQSEQGWVCAEWQDNSGLTIPCSYQSAPLQHRWEEGSHLLGSQPGSHRWEWFMLSQTRQGTPQWWNSQVFAVPSLKLLLKP